MEKVLFATDPKAASRLKALVLMCGVFTRDGLEWNAKGNPHATVITLFDEGVCSFARGAVQIELKGGRAGATAWDPGAAGGTREVATAVDAERFFERYFSVF